MAALAEPSPDGRFGEFGGRFLPESLVPACRELEAANYARYEVSNPSARSPVPG